MKTNDQAVPSYQNPVKLVSLLGISLVLGACGSSQQPAGSTAKIQAQSLTSITPVVANEEYVLRNQCGGKILDVDGVSMADGARVQTYSYVGTANQNWTVIPTDSGYYKIIAKHSGKALDVSGQGTVDGTTIQQYPYYGGTSQQWMFTDAGNGYYKLTPRNAPTKALDVVNGNVNDGASVDIYQDNGTCAQHWKLETFASLATYSGPITITRGGTYTGKWQSLDANTPAVDIQTSDPVIIQNCLIQSKGYLIKTTFNNTNVTVQNCRGYGLNPGVSGKAPGRFFSGLQVQSLTIQNNFLSGTSGINTVNTTTLTPGAISIKNNRARNIDGRHGDGSFEPAQFVQLNSVQRTANVDVSWNEVINQPFFSRAEDVISIYCSSGTAASPIAVHDNYIQGAYQANPNSASGGFSGGGIMLGDCGSAPNITSPLDFGYTRGSYNQVVGTNNHGISVNGGSHVEIDHNKAISSGLLSDGSTIPTNNVGFQMWDQYNLAPRNLWGYNSVHDNSGAWPNNTTASAYNNSFWLPDAAKNNSSSANNTNLGSVTLADEAAEYQTWLSKLTSNSKVLGTN